MPVTVTTRMYCVQELGDCFLLCFKDGNNESNLLIDCGSFRNSAKSIARMQAIAKHIKKELGGKALDLVIGTHQHNDHVSGFVHAADVFKGMIDQVWLSWLDDPSDGFARQVYHEQKGLISTLQAIYNGAKSKGLASNLTALKDVLGFYAADGSGDPEIPAKGVELLKTLGRKKTSVYATRRTSLDPRHAKIKSKSLYTRTTSRQGSFV